jgi:hypothetical protein
VQKIIRFYSTDIVYFGHKSRPKFQRKADAAFLPSGFKGLFATARAASCKFQAPKTKFQTNPNEPNSKFQTNDPSAFVPNGTTAVNVLVIGY